MLLLADSLAEHGFSAAPSADAKGILTFLFSGAGVCAVCAGRFTDTFTTRVVRIHAGGSTSITIHSSAVTKNQWPV
ncbi:hypothetical protein Sm713_63060 [Streptomyces sp. TS71-3]|nr:hypothetical protein Sm713_63060 [Streptomyces sp. TS71-3]